ncbi:MAG: hypothetical protein D4R79_10250 [Comamonadaceae bacterium]|nr:MAG: hypothetical protein D4R79_10250 [Comamonadaceae bacterium]
MFEALIDILMAPHLEFKGGESEIFEIRPIVMNREGGRSIGRWLRHSRPHSKSRVPVLFDSFDLTL